MEHRLDRGWMRVATAAVQAAVILCGLSVAGVCSAQEARWTGSWLDGGGDLRAAFREVVGAARQATVRVLSDGKQAALGTIVASDGWILTKGSQLNGELRCRLPDGRELPAENLAYDRDTDLALLKVDADGLVPIEWAADDDPRVGQWLATAGQAERPVGVGIVSVPRRAVPSEKVSGVLGVRLEDLEGIAKVADIIAESAAANADIKPGDVITRVEDRVIDSRETLVRLIREHEPGTTLKITVRRGDAELVVPATLTHPFGDFLTRIAAQNQMGGALSTRRNGFPAVLQHDTVLAPEDCGGPVVDLDGAAVGINIARAGRTETYALPANLVLPLIEELRSRARDDPQLARRSTGDEALHEELDSTGDDSGAAAGAQ